MSWHRRRIRRARHRSRELTPRRFTPGTPAPTADGPSIRRIVVFVPCAQYPPRALTPVIPLALAATAAGPA
jgi:hypothetical protein